MFSFCNGEGQELRSLFGDVQPIGGFGSQKGGRLVLWKGQSAKWWSPRAWIIDSFESKHDHNPEWRPDTFRRSVRCWLVFTRSKWEALWILEVRLASDRPSRLGGLYDYICQTILCLKAYIVEKPLWRVGVAGVSIQPATGVSTSNRCCWRFNSTSNRNCLRGFCSLTTIMQTSIRSNGLCQIIKRILPTLTPTLY